MDTSSSSDQQYFLTAFQYFHLWPFTVLSRATATKECSEQAWQGGTDHWRRSKGKTPREYVTANVSATLAVTHQGQLCMASLNDGSWHILQVLNAWCNSLRLRKKHGGRYALAETLSHQLKEM